MKSRGEIQSRIKSQRALRLKQNTESKPDGGENRSIINVSAKKVHMQSRDGTKLRLKEDLVSKKQRVALFKECHTASNKKETHWYDAYDRSHVRKEKRMLSSGLLSKLGQSAHKKASNSAISGADHRELRCSNSAMQLHHGRGQL